MKRAMNSQADLLRRLRFERVLPPQVADLFHTLRILGNNAAHGAAGTLSEALNALKYARQAGVRFHRTFGRDPSFVAGPFQPPAAPEDAAAPVRAELERLRADLLATKSAAEQARLAAEENARARQTAEQRARQEAEERATWEQLATEAEQERQALRARLDAAQRLAEAAPVNFQEVIEQGETAAQKIDLDEAATRQIVDQQLRDRGWEADTQKLHLCCRRAPGQRTRHGSCRMADRKRAGRLRLVCRAAPVLASIEAKRKRKNVSAAIDQAERYARGLFL